jgi:hypothetical protein
VEGAQYLGSAAQGLGFFHVEVSKVKGKSGFMKFLDNCAVLTIEEGVITTEEIVENMQMMFDHKWPWQLKEIEDMKYLVRFPPHKSVSTILISETTYFKIKKDYVLVSLKASMGDIESYDVLDEIWVQIRGVPPKWSSWRTFYQIACSLGKMVEIDWNSLFSSFFSMVRVKIACKNVDKISLKRLFEMQKLMYVIHFKVEKRQDRRDGGEDDDGGDNKDNGGRVGGPWNRRD